MTKASSLIKTFIFLFAFLYCAIFVTHSGQTLAQDTSSSSSGCLCTLPASCPANPDGSCGPTCSLSDGRCYPNCLLSGIENSTIKCVNGKPVCCNGNICTVDPCSSTTSSSSGSSGNVDKYILVKGPFIGIQIQTNSGSLDVRADLNPLTNANGSIFDAHKGCPNKHFHGSLFEKEDPDPQNCGWNKISDFNEVSTNIGSLSNAIHFGTTALNDFMNKNITNQQAEFNNAFLHTQQSIDSLEELKTNLSITEPTKNKHLIDNNLLCAIRFDDKAREKLNKLKDKTGHINDPKRTKGNLRSSLKCKKRLMKLLLKNEKFI